MATSFNHRPYIYDFMISAIREFDSETKILIADLGSTDGTIQMIQDFIDRNPGRMDVRQFEKSTSAIDALFKTLEEVNTEYVIGMSCDDVFGDGYGLAVKGFAEENYSNQTIFNFRLNHTDEDLNIIDVQYPKWSRYRSLNRLKLSLGNPGTGPGAIYPVEVLRTVFSKEKIPNLMVEDYFIYWNSIESVCFQNIKEVGILYRRHPNALTFQKTNPMYIESIGYSAGLANRNSRHILEKIASRILVLRWLRHFHPHFWQFFFKGYQSAVRE